MNEQERGARAMNPNVGSDPPERGGDDGNLLGAGLEVGVSAGMTRAQPPPFDSLDRVI
jgi:hypothetical protein